MKPYETVKAELLKRRSNIKGFNKAFYKQFVADYTTCRKIVADAEKENKQVSVTELWNKTETYKSYFYNHNSGAYCELLTLWE